MKTRKTILFITSCPEIWGGSEELWAGAALRLHERGHRVIAGRSEPKHGWIKHPRWIQLHEAGVNVGGFTVPVLFRAVPDACLRYLPRLAPITYYIRNNLLSFWIRRTEADLVVIAQGGTFDGMEWVELPLVAHAAEKPYVLICQKNSEIYWPMDELVGRHRNHFQNARRVFFVSEHNRQLAREMLGLPLPDSEVVRNPFMISNRRALPWPQATDGVSRLACVARMLSRDKGQDMLLRVLAMPKWRQRPIAVDFYGEGDNHEAFQGMARFFGLANVVFHGFSSDIEGVWKDHHALVLPSRAEGLPLAQVEAMACGRVPIITPAGGSGEILHDGETGFLAPTCSEAGLDDAMERAWERRHEWREIGLRASESVRRFYPEDPCSEFASKLETLLAPGA